MKNQSKNNVQVTGVETVATTNGNGKKAETKPQDNVKVIPWEDFDPKNAIRITPRIDCLTKKGIEIYTNMGDLENAKLFIDDLAMALGGGTTELTGLLMLLDAIRRKINKEDCLDHPEDFISFLQDHLFFCLNEADRAADVYIDAIRSGNFVLGELPEADYEVNAVDMRPPKHKFKSQENALRSELSELAETVKNLQAQVEGKTASVQAQPTSPITFEAVKNANVDDLGTILSALTENERLCPSINNSICDAIVKVMPPHFEADLTPSEVAETIRHENRQVFLRQTKKGYTITLSPDDCPDAFPAENEKTAPKADDLATHLSAILNDPNIPESLYNAIVDEMSSFDNDYLTKVSTTPEYIRAALKGVKEPAKLAA
jgi:hypothetical protein